MNLKHLVLSFIVLLLAACSNEETPVVTVLEIPALPDGAYLLKDLSLIHI